MSAARTKVFVDIVTKTDGKEPGSGLKKFAIGAGIAAVAVAGLIKIGKDLVNIYAVQEQAEARLEATIKATGKAAGLSADQLTDMASGLQQVTKFGDEAIIGAESLLLTFKDIGGDIFPRALESILDVSEAMGTDLQASVIQLGKALNDPILGLTSLSRSGIQFTDTQKETIKTMVEMGDKAGAQVIILEELESQFGGVARAAADTATGSMVQMKNSIGDVQEAYGELIANGLEPFARAITDQTSVLASYLNNLSESRDIIKEINDGALDSGKSLEDLNAILLDLEKNRDLKRGQITKDAEEEIRIIKILIDTYGTQDVFLTKAADSALVLARVQSDAALKQVALTSLEINARETLANITAVELTETEKELQLLQDQINFWAELRDTVEGAEELFQELASQRNELLVDQDELILKIHEDTTVMFGTVEGGLIKQSDLVKKLTIDYQKLAEDGIGAFAASFEASAEAGLSFANIIKEASKDALSAILKGLAQEALARAALALAIPFGAGIPSALLYTAAAATAFAGAGFIQSLATGGSFTTDGPQLIQVGEQGQEQVTVTPTSGSGGGGGNDVFRLLSPGGDFLAWIQREGIDNRGIVSHTGEQL